MQLTGTSPSAASICSLYPLQLSLYPLALRFVPVSQAFGNSAAISAAVIPSRSCRSSRVGSLGTSSPFFGRPRFRFGRSCGFGFGAGLSRPTIAVESLEMWPTTEPAYAERTSASCIRSGRRVSANQAKARENVDSLGTSDTRDQPHRRRSVGSYSSRSTSTTVVGMSHTAFATKARASALRSAGGLPTPRWL